MEYSVLLGTCAAGSARGSRASGCARSLCCDTTRQTQERDRIFGSTWDSADQGIYVLQASRPLVALGPCIVIEQHMIPFEKDSCHNTCGLGKGTNNRATGHIVCCCCERHDGFFYTSALCSLYLPMLAQ